MKRTLSLLSFLVLLTSSVTFGQIANQCSTVYDVVEKMPAYDKDVEGLIRYLNKELIPIVSDCMKRD